MDCKKKIKIGILTFHRSINYGAVTQCYTLTKAIQTRFPDCEVEVIDYVPQFRKDKYVVSLKNCVFGAVNPSNGFILNAKIVCSQIVRFIHHPQSYYMLKQRFEAFQASLNDLPLSKEVYTDNDVANFREKIKGKYDVIISGSDCVWEWSTVPLPNAYYLCGDFDCKKMSFAASVGTDDFKQLTNKEQKLLTEAVLDFEYIGVRDTSSEYVLRQMNEPRLNWNHNCDPTTILDIAELIPFREKVAEKIKKFNIPEGKRLIAVMGTDVYGKIARTIFGDSAVYIALYTPNSYCDYALLDLPVLEWAACFSLFDMTFTTFFHGTMLSLVNLTPVFSFDYLPERENQITKLRELYSRLSLEGFYHRVEGEFGEKEIRELKDIAEELVTHPPKENIKIALEKEAKTAEGFFVALGRIIDEVEKEK